MKRQHVSLGLVALIMVGILAGCGSRGEQLGGGEETGSVYWLNFKPEADAALQQIARSYTDKTGVPVKVTTAAQGQYESTLTAEMDKSSAPTLFVVGTDAAVDVWNDYCYELIGTPVYNELITDDYTLYDDNGKACAIGYAYECYGIIVNKKLLKQAGYEVSDIRDFQSLKAVAEDIHANAQTLGFDAFTSSGLDSASSWRFTGHLANIPLFYESRDEGGWDECPPEIKGTYLEQFKNVWDLYISNSAADPRTLATPGYDAAAEFAAGKAVFYQNGSWEFSNLVDKLGMNPEDLTMIPIYCGVEGEEDAGLCNGTENCWAVNANASEADRKATLDFMYWMVTSPEGTELMAREFGPIPYKNAVPTENVFLNAASEYLQNGKYNVTWEFSYTPNVEQWRAALASALTQYCNGGDWEAVKTAFVNGWAAQYKAANS